MTNAAIMELFEIIKIETPSQKDSVKVRTNKLIQWVSKYVETLTVENMLIKKDLNINEEEFLKYHIAYQIADKLLEDYAKVTSKGNKIEVEVSVLKQLAPKFIKG